jgi:hypothetical protein
MVCWFLPVSVEFCFELFQSFNSCPFLPVFVHSCFSLSILAQTCHFSPKLVLKLKQKHLNKVFRDVRVQSLQN